MNLHEYQAKALLAAFGVLVPAGQAAQTPAQAKTHAQSLGGSSWMVKAQLHAGGRGKAGGVKMAKSLDEVETLSKSMLGSRLVTKQTTAEGQPVNQVLIEATTRIAHEYYLSLLVDRAHKQIAIMASAAGGVNIEQVAATDPDKIITVMVDPTAGLQPYQSRRIGFALGLNSAQIKELGQMLDCLYHAFMSNDMSMLELNPLVQTGQGTLLALDAKINLDDNALYRHPDLESMRDESQEDEKETKARAHDLNYVTLDGNIACMVNGAGLAMATMDIVKLYGGEPANFLDVGGGTDAKKVAEAFKLITSDSNVRAILVNIFGGIVRCDLIAEGIIAAVRQVDVQVPVVARLEGTNMEQARSMLAQSGLAVIAADSLADAARKVVDAAAQKKPTGGRS